AIPSPRSWLVWAPPVKYCLIRAGFVFHWRTFSFSSVNLKSYSLGRSCILRLRKRRAAPKLLLNPLFHRNIHFGYLPYVWILWKICAGFGFLNHVLLCFIRFTKV